MPDRLLRMLSHARAELFDKGGAEEVFSHVRNLVVATLIMAAGIHAAQNAFRRSVPGVLSVEIVGYTVTVLAFLLALLNLFDGLHKLSQKRRSTVLQFTVVVLYLFISFRVAQLLFVFRSA